MKLPPEIRAPLASILNYLADTDEEKHFEECLLNGEDTAQHIWLDVKAVRQWLVRNEKCLTQ